MAKFAWDDHRKTQQITPEICQFAFAQAENLTKKWKICKNHEEKHKIDVKENEKTCGQHAQKLGTEAKNRLFLRPKTGVGKNGHPTFLG